MSERKVVRQVVVAEDISVEWFDTLTRMFNHVMIFGELRGLHNILVMLLQIKGVVKDNYQFAGNYDEMVVLVRHEILTSLIIEINAALSTRTINEDKLDVLRTELLGSISESVEYGLLAHE